MALPQTEAGTPAPGVDPTLEELGAITTSDGIWDWLGADQALRTAVATALGSSTTNIKLRDLVYIKQTVWDRTMGQLSIAIAEGAASGLTPIEEGHVYMARRIARLRLGLRANEEEPAPRDGGPSQGVANGPRPQGAELAILSQAGAMGGHQSAEPKLKLSVVLDPALESDLVRLPGAEVRALYNIYSKKRGAEPSPEIEPTIEQISAMAQVVGADLVPYACFSLLGPHGRRMLTKLSFLAWNFARD